MQRMTEEAMVLALLWTGFAGAMVFAEDDINEHRSCAQCGMDRKAYAYSRMLIRYEDGATTAFVARLRCKGNVRERIPEGKGCLCSRS